MAEKYLVIVESPTKAKTITKFLGKDYTVRASNGHIRDLPTSATEIPAKYKKEPWARLGINVDKDFEPLYVIPKSKKENLKKIEADLKKATLLYLATDEDREGESISWHLLEALKPKIPVKRLVFHEITKEAIKEALDSAREVDEDLVKAQETRRVVDRLFGYEVSPLLWKKMTPGLSAGRVQSVTVRLLVERERERMKFVKAGYWGIKAVFEKTGKSVESFEAELSQVKDKKVAIGKDFDAHTGRLTNPKNVVALGADEAEKLKKELLSGSPKVTSVEEKPFTTKPSAPFVTSTLQQEGNRKLRFSAKHTMSIAQRLYENGYITYMRTDSTTLSAEALNAARTLIEKEYGKDYLPKEPRIYVTKVKNAQEAHEAIRPAGAEFTPMDKVAADLGADAGKLYELIWKRTVASQMSDAKGTYVNVEVTVNDAKFKASGKTISFPGFLRAYVEGADDPEAELADREKFLPKLEVNNPLSIAKLDPTEHSTQPPARYTEGSLIKELEHRGIGRPSTWATVVETVLNRAYGFKKGTALVPTFTAFVVTGLLERYFTNLTDYEFTAKLEDDLDAISRGEADNKKYLNQFYFGNGHPGLKALVKKGEEEIDPREVNGIPLGKAEDGRDIEIRVGRFGPFISNGEDRASVPDMMTPDEMVLDEAVRILKHANKAPESIGKHPETGEDIFLKVGPYGPYVQLGEPSEDKKIRPKMASLLPGVKEEDVTLEYAVKLLSLPRDVGEHPELKENIIISNGRFGPYVKCGKETRSINLEELSPLDMTFDDAVKLLAQPKRQGRGSTPKLLKEIGKHPTSEKEIAIRSGRYGPYVTDGEINASLRKGMDPETITMDECVELLQARAERIAADGGKKKPRKKKKG